MAGRVRTFWRVRQRYRWAVRLLSVAGALAGALAVVLVAPATGDGAGWLDRDVLIPAALAACAGGLAMRLAVRGLWHAHRRLRAEEWA